MGRKKIDQNEKIIQVPLSLKRKVVEKLGKPKIQYEAEKFIKDKYDV